MTRIMIAIAGALALAAGSAWATGDKSQSASGTTPSTGTSATTGTGSSATTGTGSSATTGTTTASSDAPVSGDVASTDPVAMVITVVLPSGDQQQVNLGSDAQITRDGSTASIAQVQPGDNVRASFDSKTHKASKLDVKSKGGSKAKDNSQKDSSQQSNPSQNK
jgi:hypothetical protein